MYSTVSEIFNSAFIGLGNPEPELMTESQLAEIVFERLCFYLESIRQSDQDLSIRKSIEFQLSSGSNEYDLTAAVEDQGFGIAEPLWAERKLTNFSSGNPIWQFIPMVNLDFQSERRAEHILTVSYYGDNANQITAVFSGYGDEILTPNNTFRIWYSPQYVFTANTGQTVPIPPNLTALVVCDVQIAALAQMQIEAAKYLDKRPNLAMRMKSWDRLTEELFRRKQGWDRWFNSFCTRSRAAHRAVNHVDILLQEQATRNSPGQSGVFGWN